MSTTQTARATLPTRIGRTAAPRSQLRRAPQTRDAGAEPAKRGTGQVWQFVPKPMRDNRMFVKALASAEEAIEWFGGLSLFAWQVVREFFRRPLEFTEILKQIFEIGWRSAPLIVLSGLAIGAVLSMHTRSTLERFGAESMIPTALAFALVTETGPLITGLLVSGRVGAGIGAELGGMRVTEQIDALDSLAVNSFKYLVVTRVVACVVALPLLTVLMNTAGLLGGFLPRPSFPELPSLSTSTPLSAAWRFPTIFRPR